MNDQNGNTGRNAGAVYIQPMLPNQAVQLLFLYHSEPMYHKVKNFDSELQYYLEPHSSWKKARRKNMVGCIKNKSARTDWRREAVRRTQQKWKEENAKEKRVQEDVVSSTYLATATCGGNLRYRRGRWAGCFSTLNWTGLSTAIGKIKTKNSKIKPETKLKHLKR